MVHVTVAQLSTEYRATSVISLVLISEDLVLTVAFCMVQTAAELYFKEAFFRV